MSYHKEPKSPARNSLEREIIRILLLVVVGCIFVFNSTALALYVNEPAFSAWGLYLGGSFFVVALSHVLRRVLFPRLDLQSIAMRACEHPIGAGLVFIGVCIVLAAFVMLNGSALRV